jgi:hypothetical protein
MRYVIDIDGTICTNTNGKYQDAVPFFDRIQHINQLYDEGNIIVFHTARGMRTHNDDAIAAHNQWYEFTKKQLDGWDIKYHKLVLGKPQGDIYVDDKGSNDYDFFLRIYEQFK